MRIRRNPYECFLWFWLMVAIWIIGHGAMAAGPIDGTRRIHTVSAGETLGEIAEQYGISVEDLAAANRIQDLNRIDAGVALAVPPAKPTECANPAQTVSDPKTEAEPKEESNGKVTDRGVLVPIRKGYTLWDLSRLYGTDVTDITTANPGLNPKRLKEGQEVLIPGATEVLALTKRIKGKRPPCLKPAVTLYRVRNDETLRISLCRCNGRPNPDAIEAFSRLARDLPSNKVRKLHPRLFQMLQAVAEKFPNRRIEIISGYRTHKRQPKSESRHLVGRALDFRVEGVSNKKLKDLLLKFDNAGVGYYPNSLFVHMDVREEGEKAFWCDYSRPGEPPLYAAMGLKPHEVARLKAEKYGMPPEVENRTQNEREPRSEPPAAQGEPTIHAAVEPLPDQVEPRGDSASGQS